MGLRLFEQCGMQQAFVVGEGGEQIQAMFGQFMVLERMGVCQCFEIEVADPQAAIPFGAVFIDSLHAFFQGIQAYFIYIPDQRIGGRG